MVNKKYILFIKILICDVKREKITKMCFQRIDAMSNELETYQTMERNLIYTQFIQVYLSRKDLPGKKMRICSKCIKRD